MNYKAKYNSVSFVIAMWVLLGSIMMPTAQANPMGGIPQIPQIPAFLPSMTAVPAAAPLPIDGEWVIDSIRKRIRIEGGRAYAVDSWLHLFVLKIEPMMVVIKDITRTDMGQYSGSDLPLMGKWTAQLLPNGTLKVTVAGAFGPVNYNLTPVRVDDQGTFDMEKSGQYSPDDSYNQWPNQGESGEYQSEYPNDDEQNTSPW